VGETFETADASKNTPFGNRQWGHKLTAIFAVNKNFYITNSIKNQDNKTWYSNDFGYHLNIGPLHPYVEAGYNAGNNKFSYDYGVMGDFGFRVRPFIEMANTTEKDRASVKYGAQIQIVENLYTQVAYEINGENMDDNVSVSLFVRL
jgi:hypothetical protein